MSAASAIRAWLGREGSTRTLALLRVSLALLVYARWGRDFQLFRDMQPDRIDMASGAFFALSAALTLSTTGMLLGAASRVSTALAGLSTLAVVLWVGETLGHEPYTHHNTWALALGVALLALTPCGRSLSVDRWLAVSRARRAGEAPPPERGPLWALPLLGVHVSAIYLWGTVAKLTVGYLSGARFEHYLMYLYLGSDVPSGWLWSAAIFVFVWTGVLLEPVLAVGLWFRRPRAVLFWVGLAFHGIIYWTLPVGTFSLTMWALYLAFLDPDAVHVGIDRMLGVESPARHPPATAGTDSPG